MDWDRFVATVVQWQLPLPVREGLEAAEHEFGQVCPPEVMERLERSRVSWRDRLALWQAPRDADHPKAHVAVNVLCTPGRRFVLGYLRAMLLPDRGHMADWYCHRHRAWLPCAHLLRWLGPLAKWIP